MRTIEEIASTFEGLSPAAEGRWNVQTLVARRLHISRAADGRYAVFLEGDRDSFGQLPAIAGLEHSAEVTALPSSRKFAALKMTCEDEFHGNRVLAHITYELARRLAADPSIDNGELFREAEWVLLLLGTVQGILSVERQRGLVGECLLMRRLLVVARKNGIPARSALSKWWGHQPSRRDFSARGIAIEVKTTGQNSRLHHVGSIEQLDPQDAGEEVFLYSVGIKTDASAPRKLPDFVADVEAQLITVGGSPDAEAIDLFRSQLRGYGYDATRESVYRGFPGYLKPHLPPALYAEPGLERLRYSSFTNSTLPTMVVSVSYVLDVRCSPLSEQATELVLDRLLRSPVTSLQ